MRSSTPWILADILLTLPASSVAAAYSGLHSVGLAARDTVICGGDSSLKQCGASFPSSWCCPQRTQCLPLNNTGTTAVICCPTGSACLSIQTITCDINFQDASKFPNSSLHILDLTKSLPLCGSQCCPLGFACQIGPNNLAFCQMKNETKTSSPLTSSLTSSSASRGTSTNTNLASSSKTMPASSTPTLVTVPTANKSVPAKYIVAGVIPGLFVIALVLFFCFWGRRKVQKRREISEPIYEPQQAARTVFPNRPRQDETQKTSIATRMSTILGGRPTTSDSSSIAPLTEQFRPITPIAPLQIRTVYPPKPPSSDSNSGRKPLAVQPSNAAEQNKRGRQSSSGTIGIMMPVDADYYGARGLPSVPAVQTVGISDAGPTRDSNYRLPNASYEPRRPGR